MTRPTECEKRTAMLKEMFAEIGEGCYIEPPLHSNFDGGHVHFGKGVYANFNLTLVDIRISISGIIPYSVRTLPLPRRDTLSYRSCANRVIGITRPYA